LLYLVIKDSFYKKEDVLDVMTTVIQTYVIVMLQIII